MVDVLEEQVVLEVKRLNLPPTHPSCEHKTGDCPYRYEGICGPQCDDYSPRLANA